MRVAYVGIPRFSVALEMLRHPTLAGRPVAMLDGPGRTARVLDASEDALAAGIAPGMPLSKARALLPAAAFLPLDHARFEAAAGSFYGALADAFPAVEHAAAGAALVDLTGLRDLLGEEPIIGRQLTARVQAALGLTPHVGIADGKFPAEAAAHTAEPGHPRVVPPGEAAAFLAPLPLDLLPAAPETKLRLARLGLVRLGDLAALPLGPVLAQFGAEGRLLWGLANGRDPRPMVPRQPELPLRERLELPAPTAELPALLAAARQLLARLVARPERRGRAARLLLVRADCVGGERWERRLPLWTPAADPERLLARLRPVLEAAALPGPVAALDLTLAGLGGEAGAQGQLFGEKARDRAALREAVRSLAARFGRAPILRVVEVEPWSRIPERRWGLIDYEP